MTEDCIPFFAKMQCKRAKNGMQSSHVWSVVFYGLIFRHLHN